ncbi:MAG TPA: hypothetical protein VGM37_01050 [Armatimonadota bacterium]
MHRRLKDLILFLLALPLLSLAPPARAQTEPIIRNYGFHPDRVQPGMAVTATVDAKFVQVSIPSVVTLDLSPIGLSAAAPTSQSFGRFTASFTVPAATPSGDYALKATVANAIAVLVTPVATLHVTTAPLLQSVAFEPSGVQPGESTTLTAVVTPGDVAVTAVTADLSALGLSAATPLTASGANVFTYSWTSPADAADKTVNAAVTMTDARGNASSAQAGLAIYRLYPPGLLGLTVSPSYARPGGSVAIGAAFDVRGCTIASVSANLSALGLSAEYPLTGINSGRTGQFTVPATAPEGDYPIVFDMRDSCGHSATYAGTLHVTNGPIITSAAFENRRAARGETAVIAARIDPGSSALASVTADLSAFGLSSAEPLTNLGAPAYYYRAFIIPADQGVKAYYVPVTAADAQARASTAVAGLEVTESHTGSVLRLTANPERVRAGQPVTLTLDVTASAGLVLGVSADLSSFGLGSGLFANPTSMAPTLAFTVPADAAPGPHRVTATVLYEAGDMPTQTAASFVTAAPPLLHGDVNGDGAFTISDVVEAARIAGGLSAATGQALEAASASGSPLTALTVADAVRLVSEMSGKR